MECPKCSTKNLELRKFCSECGAKLLMTCPQCGGGILATDKFCGDCGHKLDAEVSSDRVRATGESERKHVTALFSDLSGYTAMCDRLDPEELKEIMSGIFGDIAQVVTKYEGFIEKFIGDAVLVLFGVPKAHEDDPVRAIKAAREIHDLVEAMGRKLEARIAKPLSMHTGINTGLVVTGELNLERGTHGVAGDAINLAARLSSISKPGEIVVSPYTYHQAEGYFLFDSLGPIRVSGKEEPVQIYKVQSPRELPSKTHRVSGLRAALIGRSAEMAHLLRAVDRLRRGKGTVFFICGDVGTGKSRLVEEFRATLDQEAIQWREGHAYAYSQNIPYFLLTDLVSRTLQIEERDAPEVVRAKIEARMEELIGKSDDAAPYIGSLYALSYPQLEGMSPDLWKSRLQEAVRTVFSALVQRAPTVICLEDLHWADPSSLELLRSVLSGRRYPALFLCVYRTPFTLFAGHELSARGGSYQEIRLQELSSSEVLKMTESLLKIKAIPEELGQLLQEKVEGNPFYLEELINALIESGTLIQDNGSWRLAGTVGKVHIPATIHGAIASRVDRLEKVSKTVLQEASVIGRTFQYAILRSITQFAEHIDQCLSDLERLDLISIRSFQPEIEYVFKHTLTQEVVYEGLLKKERREIHDRIAVTMERLFQHRLSEFYETLALHFKQSQSTHKAVEYLVKSGEKSWGRYALEEANQHFQDSFDILSATSAKTEEETYLLVDLLIKWAPVFNHRGDYGGLAVLLTAHEEMAKSLNDKERLGMFYGWLGLALQFREKLKDSYLYLHKALELGEEIGSHKLIGYACAWLIIT
jgi:class 3 adenylate cyclase